jgi:hypothetical protein
VIVHDAGLRAPDRDADPIVVPNTLWSAADPELPTFT